MAQAAQILSRTMGNRWEKTMIYNGNETNSLDDLEATVAQTCDTLGRHLDKFDCLVVRGMSGVVVGVPVSMRIGKPLVIVRKTSEFDPTGGNCHGDPIINKKHLDGRWLFLDDFTGSGRTRKEVVKAIQASRSTAEDAGSYMYSPDVLTWNK